MYVILLVGFYQNGVDVLVFEFQFPWAVGSILEALLALVVMTSIDHQPWRWLLGLSSLPLLIVIPLFVVSNSR